MNKHKNLKSNVLKFLINNIVKLRRNNLVDNL